MTTWKYPIELYDKQRQAVAAPVDEVLFGGSLGGGKDLALDTPVLTTTGWKTQGTLQVGDYVYAVDGTPTRVIAAHPVESNPCYRIKFSTGETITAGEGHLWNVATQQDRDSLRRRDPKWQARRRATRQSRATTNPHKGTHQQAVTAQRNRDRAAAARAGQAPVDPWDHTRTLETKDLFALHQGTKSALTIPRPRPISGGVAWPSDVPPYVLGMWLGDGSRNNAGITQGDEDLPVLLGQMEAEGFRNHNTWELTHYFRHVASGRTLDSMLNPIYGKTTSNTRVKHIPDWVYTTTYADRLAVIQGLFDADAHVNPHGQVEFCLTDRRLFEDAVRLLSTLGIRVSYRTGVAAYRKPDGTRVVTGTRYRTKFTTEVPVFRYPRKLARIDQGWTDPNHANRRSNITIESIEPCETVPTRCIGVDHPRALYLAGSTLVPTHNTEMILKHMVDICCLVPNAKTLVIRRSFPELVEIAGRLKKRIPPQLATYNKSDHVLRFHHNGAELHLGYLDSEDDATRYQGQEYVKVGFDELTHYDKEWVALVTSRIRGTGQIAEDMARHGFTMGVLAASNPGGRGHAWTKETFIDPAPAGEPFTGEDGVRRVFIPSSLYDNPFIDHEDYVRRLGALDPERKRALIEGDWTIPAGTRFPQFRERVHVIKPEDFPIPPVGVVRVVGVDYGINDPFAAVWAAKVGDTIVVYRDHVQDGLAASQQAAKVLELESEEERLHSDVTVALDPNGWARNPHFGGKKLTPGADEAPLGSIAYAFREALGDRVVKGWNPRVQGWAIFDELMVERDTGTLDEDGNPVKLPRILIYDTCRELIRFMSSAPRAKRDPQDVDTTWRFDHVGDAARYCISELLGLSYNRPLSGHERLRLEGTNRSVTAGAQTVSF